MALLLDDNPRPPISFVWLCAAVLAGTACAKAQTDTNADAMASARDAQIRAEAELKVLKEAAARQAALLPPVAPAAQAGDVTQPRQDASATSAPSEASTKCGCREAGCSCVTVVVSLTVAAHKPGTRDWDALGGAPDPQVTLRTPSAVFKSAVFADQLGVIASFTDVALSAGQPVTVEAFDKDAMTSDPIGAFSTKFPGRPATVTGEMAAASVKVEFRR